MTYRKLPINKSGVYSSRPSSPTNNSTYVPTDGGPSWVYISGVWKPLDGGILGSAPPSASGWTARNAGTSSITDTNGGLYVVGQNNGSNDYLNGYEKTSDSSTGYILARLRFLPNSFTTSASSYGDVGLFLAENGTGKIRTICASIGYSAGTTFIASGTWASATSRTSSSAGAFVSCNSDLFLKIAASGSNIITQWSVDRKSWFTIATTPKTTAFTTQHDRAGIYTGGRNSIPAFVTYDLEYT